MVDNIRKEKLVGKTIIKKRNRLSKEIKKSYNFSPAFHISTLVLEETVGSQIPVLRCGVLVLYSLDFLGCPSLYVSCQNQSDHKQIYRPEEKKQGIQLVDQFFFAYELNDFTYLKEINLFIPPFHFIRGEKQDSHSKVSLVLAHAMTFLWPYSLTVKLEV